MLLATSLSVSFFLDIDHQYLKFEVEDDKELLLAWSFKQRILDNEDPRRTNYIQEIKK